MTQSALAGTRGLAMCQEMGLDRLMVELEEQRRIPLDLRKQLIAKKQALSLHQRGELLTAQDMLKGEEANVFLMMLDEKHTDGKAKWSNEEARKARVIQLQREDAGYQAALTRYRKAEGDAENLRQDIAEIEDQVKSAAEVIYAIKEQIRGASAAIMAVCTFDGPTLPREIRLLAPESLPAIAVTTKEAA